MRETQLLVKSKVDVDEEKVKERQELTRTKSPTELSQISSISDLPIPAPVENLLKKKRYVFLTAVGMLLDFFINVRC